MAPPPPPGLMDDLIGEILVRLPPEDPSCLVRASLVCKPWRRLLADPGFPRRYREFHGAPPLLGFFHNYFRRFFVPRFIPIKEASPNVRRQLKPPASTALAACYIVDCRHGRVLLFNIKTDLLTIWHPFTNSQHHIVKPNTNNYLYEFTAAVLCAMDGCDHLSCRGGPSLVVFLHIDNDPYQQQGASATAIAYSTETGTWNAGVTLSSVRLGTIKYDCLKTIGSSLLVEDAVYFLLEDGRRILKYDMAAWRLSVMRPPPLAVGNMVLMKAEGGGLGACGVESHSLSLWAWRTGPGGIWGWKQVRVIQLDIGDLSRKLSIVDFAEGAGSIFLRAYNGIFAVELKSGHARKIGKGGKFTDIFPYMSFYIPSTSLVTEPSKSYEIRPKNPSPKRLNS